MLSPLACGSCNAIFPVGEGTSHFTRLGIPESFTVDVGEAQVAFLRLTRDLHPDFFMDRPEAEQALSLEHSAQLNEAWAVIQDPFRRAAYLIDHWSPQQESERDTSMPPGFLEEMLFLREEIDELAEEEAGPERNTALDGLRSQLQEKRDELVDSLSTAFGKLEQGRNNDTLAEDQVAAVRAVLNASRYITNALDAVRNAQD